MLRKDLKELGSVGNTTGRVCQECPTNLKEPVRLKQSKQEGELQHVLWEFGK